MFDRPISNMTVHFTPKRYLFIQFRLKMIITNVIIVMKTPTQNLFSDNVYFWCVGAFWGQTFETFQTPNLSKTNVSWQFRLLRLIKLFVSNYFFYFLSLTENCLLNDCVGGFSKRCFSLSFLIGLLICRNEIVDNALKTLLRYWSEKVLKWYQSSYFPPLSRVCFQGS